MEEGGRSEEVREKSEEVRGRSEEVREEGGRSGGEVRR